MKTYNKQIEVPKNIEILHKAFQEHNYQLYLVGGCVRDSLLRRAPKDYDLATNINPDEIINVVKNISGLKYVDEDSRFGVIRVIFNKKDEYEIVTFRSDGDYLDNRRPDTVYFGSMEDDAKRRDFTINAMYYDIDNSQVIDYNNGMDDLNKRKLRFVGDSRDRLSEDPLRLLRAIRFAFRYDLDIDLNVLREFSDLNGVSNERIRKEFLNAYKSKVEKRCKLIQMYVDSGVFEKVFGFPTHIDYDIDLFEKINVTPFVLIGYLMYIHNFNGDVKKHLNELKYTKEEAETVNFTLRLLRMTPNDYYGIQKYIDRTYKTGFSTVFFDVVLPKGKQAILKSILYSERFDSTEVSLKYNVSGVELGKKLQELQTEAIINFKPWEHINR